MIEEITGKDYRHLIEIAPGTVRERNDKHWMLLLVSREPKAVAPRLMAFWQREYPAAFITAIQRIEAGEMVVDAGR
jgi:hypothetical protein